METGWCPIPIAGIRLGAVPSRIASLQEYVMVAQDRMLVERYRRQDDGWHYIAYDAPEQSLHLSSIACTLPLQDIYRKVRFPTEHPPLR
jgi:hypothetical protein